jgi:hypothetical protein
MRTGCVGLGGGRVRGQKRGRSCRVSTCGCKCFREDHWERRRHGTDEFTRSSLDHLVKYALNNRAPVFFLWNPQLDGRAPHDRTFPHRHHQWIGLRFSRQYVSKDRLRRILSATWSPSWASNRMRLAKRERETWRSSRDWRAVQRVSCLYALLLLYSAAKLVHFGCRCLHANSF